MLLRWWVGARTVAIRASPASIFFEDQEMTSLSKMISLSNRIQGHFLPAETSTELLNQQKLREPAIPVKPVRVWFAATARRCPRIPFRTVIYLRRSRGEEWESEEAHVVVRSAPLWRVFHVSRRGPTRRGQPHPCSCASSCRQRRAPADAQECQCQATIRQAVDREPHR